MIVVIRSFIEGGNA